MEEKSDIRFEYEGIKEGRKTKRILFTIYRNTPKNPDVIDERKIILDANSKPRQMEMPYDFYPELYEDFIGHNQLAKEDIDLLLSRSGHSEEKVRRAIKLADEQGHISNYMGWLLKCIENDYQIVETVDGDSVKADKIREIRADVDNNKTDLAKKVWKKTQTNEVYPDFMNYIRQMMNEEIFETVYSDEEKVQMFVSWKTGKDVKFF